MILISANNLKKSFGDEVLFSDVSFSVDSADKIGFVGINGAGKSTLFKIITGEMEPDSGDIFINKNTVCGYLTQHACSESKKTVFDEILEVFSEQVYIESELEAIRGDINTGLGDLDSLIKRQNKLSERFAEIDGFFYKNKIKSALIGLGFSEEDFGLSVEKLSGGERTRVELCKILLSGADVLLLDEPTNHLDIQSVEWLEEFLISYKGAVIVISHDRFFLDRVTNRTFSMESGNFHAHNGNYTFFQKQREIERLTERRSYDNTKKEIERLEGIVEQQRRWNREKNIKTAESKLKVIEKLEKDLKKPEELAEGIEFKFRARAGGGDEALTIRGLSKRFGEKTLFSDLNLDIKRGERVFLLGPNGCGKSTLIKLIMDAVVRESENIKIGANTYLGYFDQVQSNLSMEKTVIDELWDEYPKMTETEVRNALAVFMFRGEDVFKEIKKLSGGERARVELAKLILKDVNFLVMDEPTNHLDIQSKEALEAALSDYNGTILTVSHDRYFINKLADRIIYLDERGLQNFPGNYDYFTEKFKVAKEPEKKKQEGVNDYKLQKQKESERRKLKTRITRLEEEIANVEEEIDKLNAELNQPEIAADYKKAFEITEKISELTEKLEVDYSQWEELQALSEEDI